MKVGLAYVSQWRLEQGTKKTPPNIEVYPESLGTMLEYCYISNY